MREQGFFQTFNVDNLPHRVAASDLFQKSPRLSQLLRVSAAVIGGAAVLARPPQYPWWQHIAKRAAHRVPLVAVMPLQMCPGRQTPVHNTAVQQRKRSEAA